MCRWLAYTGSPVLLTDVLYTPVHSLIDQSLHSRLGAETTNGDGFGIGWYDTGPVPGVFRSIEPAWNDQNLREFAGHIRSALFFAHIRAAIGSAVQQTNCHPFRHGRWLFMHNGFIDGFAKMKRDLVLAIDPSLFPEIMGQPTPRSCSTWRSPSAWTTTRRTLSRAPSDSSRHAGGSGASTIRSRAPSPPPTARACGCSAIPAQGRSRSLFFSRDVRTAPRQYPGPGILQQLSDDARFVVSEPIGDLPGAWIELPEASYGSRQQGRRPAPTLHPQTPVESPVTGIQLTGASQVSGPPGPPWPLRARSVIPDARQGSPVQSVAVGWR